LANFALAIAFWILCVIVFYPFFYFPSDKKISLQLFSNGQQVLRKQLKENRAPRKSLPNGKCGIIICRMAKSINPDDLLTVAQAADERGTSRQAINYLVRQGKLETVEIAGRRFITRKALAEYTPDPGGRPPSQTTPEKAATGAAKAGNGTSTGKKKGGKK
jgi:hypothetical protein